MFLGCFDKVDILNVLKEYKTARPGKAVQDMAGDTTPDPFGAELLPVFVQKEEYDRERKEYLEELKVCLDQRGLFLVKK
jgi:hypothetical protein